MEALETEGEGVVAAEDGEAVVGAVWADEADVVDGSGVSIEDMVGRREGSDDPVDSRRNGWSVV